MFLLGSIHVLRPRDYPLPRAVDEAYGRSRSLVMEADLDELEDPKVQAGIMARARLPDGQSLAAVLGDARYARAERLARALGMELSAFDRFEPWFAAEGISQMQLGQLGFKPENGVETYFMQRARQDGKRVVGLETIGAQIALFADLPLDTQSEYLIASLEESKDLPAEVDAMVGAWRRGDSAWFRRELDQEFGKDPHLYEALLGARNRHWLPKIEALLRGEGDVLVIVGAGHLLGRDSVIDLLRRDGIEAIQH